MDCERRSGGSGDVGDGMVGERKARAPQKRSGGLRGLNSAKPYKTARGVIERGGTKSVHQSTTCARQITYSSIDRTIAAACPRMTALAATFLVTIAPAPTNDRSPIVSPGRTTAPAPTDAPRLIMV